MICNNTCLFSKISITFSLSKQYFQSHFAYKMIQHINSFQHSARGNCFAVAETLAFQVWLSNFIFKIYFPFLHFLTKNKIKNKT